VPAKKRPPAVKAILKLYGFYLKIAIVKLTQLLKIKNLIATIR